MDARNRAAHRPVPSIDPGASATIGGARAEFVAALGRRTAELTRALETWQAQPHVTRARDDVRRRVHALAVRARLHRFVALASELERCEERFGRDRAELADRDARELRAIFQSLPALAWGQTSLGLEPTGEGAEVERTTRASDGPEFVAPPVNVLVVGPVALADALRAGEAPRRGSLRESLEIERTEDARIALDLARAFAPDVALVDADLPGALDLVRGMLDDPFTEPVRVVVVGRWAEEPDEPARTTPDPRVSPRPRWASFGASPTPFLQLGVASTVRRPVGPSALRRACVDAVRARRPLVPVHEPIGPSSIDELAVRLADELRRGICDAADERARGERIDFEDGSDLLAAVWGAVARVRDVVAARTDGAVRLAADGPDGGVAVAFGVPGAGHEATSARATAPELALAGTVAYVADDDPAVTWFLAGVLRAAGALVREFHDGAAVLSAAYRAAPDLVITDLVMPKIDGFALCRAIKRDLVLRDVPVLLLSWKEDLLQRVREIGADADGYLRKEASAAAIVQRAREVLRPRHRVGMRLDAEGEVRGRVDGLTTITLMRLAAARRPDAVLSVRDAAFVYEVLLRDGAPVRATRAAADGALESGTSVLSALLGVRAGRFAVSARALAGDGDALRADAKRVLEGSLDAQLAPRIAKARGAQRLLAGEALLRVVRVGFDDGYLAAYLAAMPREAQGLLRRLAGGAKPSDVLVRGDGSARLVEDVLSDAAAHGAVHLIVDESGRDMLPDAMRRALAELGESGATAPAIEQRAADEPACSNRQPDVSLASDVPTLPAEPVSVTHAPVKDDDGTPTAIPGAAVDAVASASEARAPAAVTVEPMLPTRAGPSIPVPAIEVPVDPMADTLPFARKRSGGAIAVAIAIGALAAVGLVTQSTERASTDAGAHAAAVLLAAVPTPFGETLPPPPALDVDTAPRELQAELVDAPLDASDSVPPGHARLEVFAPTAEAILVDGKRVGRGPIVRVSLAARPTPYELRLKRGNQDRVQFVPIKAGRLARFTAGPPWSR